MRRLGILAATVLLAGCSPAGPSAGGTSATATTDSTDLVALREQWNVPDCPETDPAAEAVQGGLPQTQLQCLGSDRVVNLAGLRRTPMVVNLWAQWCEPCRAESGILREGSDEGGVAFVGINYQDPQPDWAIEFAGTVKWTYPHVADPERSLRAPLSVPGLPTTLFVGTDGKVVGRHSGELDSADQLRGLIDQYLGDS